MVKYNRCPFCRAVIHKNSKICNSCGKDVSEYQYYCEECFCKITKWEYDNYDRKCECCVPRIVSYYIKRKK